MRPWQNMAATHGCDGVTATIKEDNIVLLEIGRGGGLPVQPRGQSPSSRE